MYRVMGIICANYASDGLSALTDQRTIASLPFAGRYRLVDFPLSNMVNSGIQTVGITLPYKYRSIIDHIGAGKEWGLDRKIGGLFILPGSVFGVSNSGHRFLLRDFRRNMIFFKRTELEYVLVAGTSCIYNMDYNDLLKQHIDRGADITLIGKTLDEDDPHLKGITVEKGRVSALKDGALKGEIGFLDGFIISRELFLEILEWYEAVDYMDLFAALSNDLEKFDVKVFELEGYGKGIHTVKEYFDRNMDRLDPSPGNDLFAKDRPIMTKVSDMVPTKYYKGSRVSNSLIPDGCVIKGKVEDSILFRNVIVEKGAIVKNSIILQGCIVKKGAVVANAILDRNNVIGEETILAGTPNDILLMDKKG